METDLGFFWKRTQRKERGKEGEEGEGGRGRGQGGVRDSPQGWRWLWLIPQV